MSDQQPKASAAACLSETAEKESDSEGLTHTLCSSAASYNSNINNAASYVQGQTVNNADEPQFSNNTSTPTTSPDETFPASKSTDQPPLITYSKPTEEVSYHIKLSS